jgi:hypothetical protein
MVGEPAPTEISLFFLHSVYPLIKPKGFFPLTTANCQLPIDNLLQLLFTNLNLVVGADAIRRCGHFFFDALGQRNVAQFGTNFLTFS